MTALDESSFCESGYCLRGYSIASLAPTGIIGHDSTRFDFNAWTHANSPLDEINHVAAVADSLAFTIEQMRRIDEAYRCAFDSGDK
jgi:hypothetical protein